MFSSISNNNNNDISVEENFCNRHPSRADKILAILAVAIGFWWWTFLNCGRLCIGGCRSQDGRGNVVRSETAGQCGRFTRSAGTVRAELRFVLVPKLCKYHLLSWEVLIWLVSVLHEISNVITDCRLYSCIGEKISVVWINRQCISCFFNTKSICFLSGGRRDKADHQKFSKKMPFPIKWFLELC